VLFTEVVELRQAGDPKTPGSIEIGTDPLDRTPASPAERHEPATRATVQFELLKSGDPSPLLSRTASTFEHLDADETVSMMTIANRARDEIRKAARGSP
jgi:hypothetical protein